MKKKLLKTILTDKIRWNLIWNSAPNTNDIIIIIKNAHFFFVNKQNRVASMLDVDVKTKNNGIEEKIENDCIS